MPEVLSNWTIGAVQRDIAEGFDGSPTLMRGFVRRWAAMSWSARLAGPLAIVGLCRAACQSQSQSNSPCDDPLAGDVIADTGCVDGQCPAGGYCASDGCCYATSSKRCTEDADCKSLGGVCDTSVGICAEGGGHCTVDADYNASLGEVCNANSLTCMQWVIDVGVGGQAGAAGASGAGTGGQMGTGGASTMGSDGG